MKLTVIVPAFNEEACLAGTLHAIDEAVAQLRARPDVDADVVVVDNASVDATGAIARRHGATVVQEPVQGIARARNAGARSATGGVLVFIDADVIVPRSLLDTIGETMRDSTCVGGGVDVDYRPRRAFVRFYLRAWRLLARVTGMVQGAAQFCRRDAFAEVGGYDESVWIGEDVDFYWSLRTLAGRTGRHVRVLPEPRVRPSCRRFDQWPVWKTLVWTNPVVIGLFRRWRAVWKGWYSDPVR